MSFKLADTPEIFRKIPETHVRCYCIDGREDPVFMGYLDHKDRKKKVLYFGPLSPENQASWGGDELKIKAKVMTLLFMSKNIYVGLAAEYSKKLKSNDWSVCIENEDIFLKRINQNVFFDNKTLIEWQEHYSLVRSEITDAVLKKFADKPELQKQLLPFRQKRSVISGCALL